jgi:hypothetical protein
MTAYTDAWSSRIDGGNRGLDRSGQEYMALEAAEKTAYNKFMYGS